MSCRLNGRIQRGRERVRVRILDISEGGLCLLVPVWLDPKQPAALAIDVPGRATAQVQIEIWHIRREKSKSSTNKVWIAGAVLRDSDRAYAQLLEAAGLVEKASSAAAPSPTPAPAESQVETIDSVEPRVFRLHCKAKGSPRSRVLTIAAESEEEARKLAEADLGRDWDLLEVRET